MIVFYACIFSLHALGSGAIIRQGLGAISLAQILVCAISLGAIIGSLIAASVAATDNYRPIFMRILDSYPGIVVGMLFFAISWGVLHMLFEVIGEPSYSILIMAVCSALCGAIGSMLVQTKHIEGDQPVR